MKLVLAVALSAVLSAAVSVTVVLVADPGGAEAADSSRVTQVKDAAVLNALHKVRRELRVIRNAQTPLYRKIREIDVALGDATDPESSGVNGKLFGIERNTENTCRAIAADDAQCEQGAPAK